MTESTPSRDVLYNILDVLKRIESKLEGHEERFKSLEYHTQMSNGGTTADGFHGNADTPSETPWTAKMSHTSTDALQPSRKGTPTSEESLGDPSAALKVPYSQWSINQSDRFFKLSLSKLLEARLGDCWGMPDDDRLPLKFFKTNILKSDNPFGVPMMPVDSFPLSRQPFERDLEFLCQFDNNLRAHPGNDFMVVDFDATENTRLYRLGDKAFGSELQVEAQGSKSAPWSRLMSVAQHSSSATFADLFQLIPRGHHWRKHSHSNGKEGPATAYTILYKHRQDLGIMGSPGLPLTGKAEKYHNESICKRLGWFPHILLRNMRSYRMASQGALEAWSAIRTSSRLAFSQMRVHGELLLVQVDYDINTDGLCQIYSPVSVDTLAHPEHVLKDLNRYWTLLVSQIFLR